MPESCEASNSSISLKFELFQFSLKIIISLKSTEEKHHCSLMKTTSIAIDIAIAILLGSDGKSLSKIPRNKMKGRRQIISSKFQREINFNKFTI